MNKPVWCVLYTRSVFRSDVGVRGIYDTYKKAKKMLQMFEAIDKEHLDSTICWIEKGLYYEEVPDGSV